MVIVNVFYLYCLYTSLKQQAIQMVTECVRKADLSEMVIRLKEAYNIDDSFLKINDLIIHGRKGDNGYYSYSDAINQMSESVSHGFHDVFDDRNDLSMNYERMDSLFLIEMHQVGLNPKESYILSYGSNNHNTKLWSFDYSIGLNDPPIYTIYISPLRGYVLTQMFGVIISSSVILIVMILLVWYLIYSIGNLRTLEQMKDDFTHNMTHELKTPVAVAYSAADSLLRYYDQSDEIRNKQFINIILKRLNYLSGMIENILSISMERFKSIRLNKEHLYLKPYIEDILGMMELKSCKPIKFELIIPESLQVLADPLHFGNVISNIVDNSIKYSGETLNITITANQHFISLTDNGVGIDKRHLPFIFDKFYRVTSGNKYSVEGYGLGLFYVRNIVTLHGWNIKVSSEVNKGTSFTINFMNDEKK